MLAVPFFVEGFHIRIEHNHLEMLVIHAEGPRQEHIIPLAVLFDDPLFRIFEEIEDFVNIYNHPAY